MRIIAACIVALTFTFSARAADVDWKVYGFASVDGGAEVCFYDDRGITPTAGGRLLRVWTKCLLQKDLDSVDTKGELGSKIVENSARKVVDKYVPPIAVVEDIDFNQAVTVIQYEETANLSAIQSQARFLYEMNCPERMMRRLSTYVRTNKGREGFSDQPSDWAHVPPEGSGATLLKILCPKF